MASKSIQFFGRDKVIEAYDYAGIETWSIFQEKQFITAGAGAEQLSEFLQMLEPSGSAAAYTLKVYRGLDDPEKVTDKTECHGSFNFRLTEKPVQMQGGTMSGPVRSMGVADAVSAKIAAIVTAEVNEAIDKKFNGGADEDKEETISDIVIGYLKEPERLLPVLGALRGLFAPVAGAGLPAAIAGVQPAEIKRAGSVGAMPAVSQDEQQTRLINVLNRLEEKDTKILQHLEALADLAEKKPALFNMLLMQLDSGI